MSLALRRGPIVGGIAVGRLLRRLGLGAPHLDAARLLSRAEDLAGSDRWGEPDPRPALERLTADLDTQAALHLPGRFAARFDLLRLLEQRLRIEAALERGPAITRTPITRPLFVIGLPRTGTTALHNLLSQDPAYRAPLTWELMYPAPGKADTAADAAARRRRAARQIRWLDGMAPDIHRMHAVGPDLPQECLSITAHSMESFQFQSMYRVPRYQRWLEARDRAPVYRYHRRFLQFLQRHDPDRRWTLKAPAHLFGLEALLAVYPDADVIQTHRAPEEVMASLASLSVNLRRAFSDRVDPCEVGAEVVERWSSALEHALAARDALEQPQRFYDVRYQDFVADPIACVEGIYRHFGYEWTPELRATMERYHQGHPQHRYGRHRYRLEDYGFEAETIGRRLAGYKARYLS